MPYRRKKLTFAISSSDEFLFVHVTCVLLMMMMMLLVASVEVERSLAILKVAGSNLGRSASR